MKNYALITAVASIAVASGFSPVSHIGAGRSTSNNSVPSATNDLRMSKDGDGGGRFNPFKEIGEAFQNLDDIIDDFYNKRMGKGEIFYGKRKYKPSGTVEGDYNGLGLTDKQCIDDAREYKAQFEEERRLRREMAELRRTKDERDRARYQ